MRKLLFTSLILFVLIVFVQAEIQIYFGPNGGYHPNNKNRTVTMMNGQVLPATLNNSILAFLDNVEEGGTIKIAMYSFSYEPIQQALIYAAKYRKIKVKLLMDGVMPWSKQMREDYQKIIKDEIALAKKENRIFDFQVRETTQEAMQARGRFKFEPREGKNIYGSMHEKFGISFAEGSKIPLDGFCGSANFSASASDLYAENRIVFKNEPSIGRQLAEEFARLWNEYCRDVTEICESESFIPTTTNLSEVQIVSNSKPIDEERVQRIDETLMGLMNQANRNNGSIDIAMFSFTHLGLANKILEIAEFNTRMKVRILMDQTQFEDDDDRQGTLGQYFVRKIEEKRLQNVEVRFRWRSNVFAWDIQKKSPGLIHFRNPLFHHKCMIVNRSRMALGSYNWSASGEFRNFENIMLFYNQIPTHKEIVERFLYEFDMVWNSLKSDGPATDFCPQPQVVTTKQAGLLKGRIYQALYDSNCRKIMELLEGRNAGYSEEELLKRSRISPEILKQKLVQLQEATLIFKKIREEQVLYQIAD